MKSHVNNYDIFRGEDLKIADRIQKRRLQILIHSCIYYNLNKNIISDKEYDTWSRELQSLQEAHPTISKQVCWYRAFEGFDASTGFDLPINDPWVVNKANYILGMYEGKEL